MTDNVHIYKNIHGWFDWEPLYKEILFIIPDQGSWVEIGSWLGKSASFAVVETYNMGRKLNFHVVDSWKPMRDIDDPYQVFMDNIISTNIPDPLTAHKVNSVEGSRLFQDSSLDFIYLDGDHAYESVKEDIRLWQPKLKENAILAGHDYGGWPGVEQAVREIFHDNVFIFCGMSWLYLGEHHPLADYINAVWDFQEGYLDKAWDFFSRLALSEFANKRVAASIYFHLASINDLQQKGDNFYWEKGAIALEGNPGNAEQWKKIINNFNIDLYAIAMKSADRKAWVQADFWIDHALQERTLIDRRIRLLFKKGEIKEHLKNEDYKFWFRQICGLLEGVNLNSSEKYIYASSLKKLGKYREAKEVFNQILFSEHDKNMESGLFYHLADIALVEGNVGEARTFANKALFSEPDHWKAKEILKKCPSN